MKTYENGAKVYVNRYMTIYPGIITKCKMYKNIPDKLFYKVKFAILEPYDDIKICEEEFDSEDIFEDMNFAISGISSIFSENLKNSYLKLGEAVASKGGFDFIKNSEVDYDEQKLKELAGIGDDE